MKEYKKEMITWPALPRKSFFGRYNPNVVWERAQAFNTILSCIALHPILQNSPIFCSFILKQQDAYQKESPILLPMADITEE